MKRDIKINYGTLEGMYNSLTAHLSNLMQMKVAINRIDTLIASSEGESVEAIKESYQYTTVAIDAFKERITDLRTLIHNYTVAMTVEIQPINKGAITRADSNDTWWNITAIDTSFQIVSSQQYYTYVARNNAAEDDSWKIARINAEIAVFKNVTANAKERLWQLHEKIARYEDTDDSFAATAHDLYQKYTDGTDRAFDGITQYLQGLERFYYGILIGLKDLVVGIFSIPGLVPLAIYAITKPQGICPDWLSGYVENSVVGIYGFLKDPFGSIAAMGNRFADSFDEDPAFAIGTLVPDIASIFIPGGAALKVAKVTKLTKVVKVLDDLPGVVKITVRERLLNEAQNPRLRNTINEIYRQNAAIGDGGLADAVRHELRTGELVGGRSHIQKAVERAKNLESIIRTQNLSPRDLEIANALLSDLKNALEGR